MNPETGNPYTYDEWRNNVGDIRTDDVPNTNLDGSKFVPPTDPVPEEPQSIEDFDESKYFDSDDNDPNDPPVPPTTDGNGPTVSPTNNGGSNIPPKENIPTKGLMVVRLSRMHILNKQVFLLLKIEPSRLRLRMIVVKELQVPRPIKILLIVLDLLTIFLQNINQVHLQ